MEQKYNEKVFRCYIPNVHPSWFIAERRLILVGGRHYEGKTAYPLTTMSFMVNFKLKTSLVVSMISH
jgi:hypothetical protein